MKVLNDVLHYGSAGLLILLAAINALGIHLPGVTVNPDVAFAAGVGILAAGFKSGITTKEK